MKNYEEDADFCFLFFYEYIYVYIPEKNTLKKLPGKRDKKNIYFRLECFSRPFQIYFTALARVIQTSFLRVLIGGVVEGFFFRI